MSGALSPEERKDWEAYLRGPALEPSEAGSNDSRPALVGLSHAEVLDLRFEGVCHLVDELIEPGTVGFIAGIPETHKSHLGQAIASGVALGAGTVLGRDVQMQGPVGFFWQDDSRRNEAERVQTYSAARNLPRELPVRWFLNEDVRLPKDLGLLREQVQLHGFVLIVLDSFYNFAPGVSLKDEDAAAIITRVKLEICDATGCTVLIVDHSPWPTESNKGQRRAYGSVLKSAAARWSIHLERDGSKLHVSARGNNVRGLKRTPVCWDEDEHELRLVDTTVEDRSAEELDRDVLEFITEQPGSSTTKVREGVRVRDSSIDASLKRLKERAEVRDLGRDGGPWSGRRGAPRYWHPASEADFTSAQLFRPGSADLAAGEP